MSATITKAECKQWIDTCARAMWQCFENADKALTVQERTAWNERGVWEQRCVVKFIEKLGKLNK